MVVVPQWKYCCGQGAALSRKGSAELPDPKHCTVPGVGSNSRYLGFREKCLYCLSHGSALFLINPGIIRASTLLPPNPPVEVEDFMEGGLWLAGWLRVAWRWAYFCSLTNAVTFTAALSHKGSTELPDRKHCTMYMTASGIELAIPRM